MRNFGKNPHIMRIFVFIKRDDKDIVPYDYRTAVGNIKP